jgi:CheY-like chemotaxis protein
MDEPRSGLGALMVDAGMMSRRELAVAEHYADVEHLQLVDAVVAVGLVQEIDSYRMLAKSLGASLVDPNDDDDRPGRLALQLLPAGLARRCWAIPMSVDNRHLTFATCLTSNPEAEADIALMTGRRAVPRLATRTAILRALERYYGDRRDPTVRRGPAAAFAEPTAPAEAGPRVSDPLVGSGVSRTEASRVLVCATEPAERLLVKLLLEREGYEVAESRTDAEMKTIGDGVQLSLVVINCQTARGWYRAIADMRRHASTASIPVMVVTSEHESIVEQRVVEVGIDDYVLKPFDAHVLLSRVNAAFRRLTYVAA